MSESPKQTVFRNNKARQDVSNLQRHLKGLAKTTSSSLVYKSTLSPSVIWWLKVLDDGISIFNYMFYLVFFMLSELASFVFSTDISLCANNMGLWNMRLLNSIRFQSHSMSGHGPLDTHNHRLKVESDCSLTTLHRTHSISSYTSHTILSQKASSIQSRSDLILEGSKPQPNSWSNRWQTLQY